MRNVNTEQLLYKIMNEMYLQNAPVVFKGALVTKTILNQNKSDLDMNRHTFDIDCDWIRNIPKPSMDEMKNYIQSALDNIESN